MFHLLNDKSDKQNRQTMSSPRLWKVFGIAAGCFIVISSHVSKILAAELSEHTSVGGYGELHLNYKRPSGGSAPAPVLDFHRWILFVNHQWTDHWSLNSELELEHNFVKGGEKTGELELEQAYIQYNPVREIALQVGVLLPATGLLNDKHEPNRFLSVERPLYANAIVPTTWFGNGIAVRGIIANALQYNMVLLEGLDDRKYGASGIRNGRPKGFNASLETVLLNPAIDFVMIPGLNIGTAAAINLLADDSGNKHPYASTVVWTLHAQFKKAGLWTQAEFGMISYNKNNEMPGVDTLAVLKQSMGWYADIGYDIARLWKAEKMQLYPFIRYTQVNSSDYVIANGTVSRFLFGLSVLPIANVTFKLDYAIENKKGASGTTGLLNFGVGYAF